MSLIKLYISLFKAFIKAINYIRPFCKFEFFNYITIVAA